MKFGMTEAIGHVNYEAQNQYSKPYSEYTNALIDDEVQSIAQACYVHTRELLESKKELIE